MDRSSIVRAIRHPFTLDIFGELTATTTEAKIYLDRLLTLLSTQVGQRPMSPDYGTDIAKALFENDDDFYTAVRVAITDAVARWLPELTISSLTLEEVDDQGYANIGIVVELPDAKLSSVSISSAIFGANGIIERTNQ